MNNINSQQTGGFPLSTDILNEIQTAYSIINGGFGMVGNLSVISGCIESGNNISGGIVYIDGEIIEFKGGIKGSQTTVVISEEKTQAEFENGQIKDIVFKRYVEFGSGLKSYKWADFKRVFPLRDIAETFEAKEDKTTVEKLTERLEELERKSAVFQAGGGMVFWNKPISQIPEGWQEVKDWKGRIPIGLDPDQIDFNVLGKQGGESEVTISRDVLPEIDLGYVGKYGNGFPRDSNHAIADDQIGTWNSFPRESINIGELGKGKELNILNPYRVVIFIEYIGDGNRRPLQNSIS